MSEEKESGEVVKPARKRWFSPRAGIYHGITIMLVSGILLYTDINKYASLKSASGCVVAQGVINLGKGTSRSTKISIVGNHGESIYLCSASDCGYKGWRQHIGKIGKVCIRDGIVVDFSVEGKSYLNESDVLSRLISALNLDAAMFFIGFLVFLYSAYKLIKERC
jgi:hypothetical protein